MGLSRLVIQRTGPICNCKTQSIGWYISQKTDGTLHVAIDSLVLKCKHCGVELSVPYKTLSARIVCEQPYPDKAEMLPDGTVVDTSDNFFKNLEAQNNLNEGERDGGE